MMRDPNMVFATDPRHGLVARSGGEQEAARTVLRDLGWGVGGGTARPRPTGRRARGRRWP